MRVAGVHVIPEHSRRPRTITRHKTFIELYGDDLDVLDSLYELTGLSTRSGVIRLALRVLKRELERKGQGGRARHSGADRA